MLGNVAGRWRGWLLNYHVPETEHQGCALHTADLALCTVWFNKCDTFCLLNHQCCACGADFFAIRLYDVSVRSLKFVENLTLSKSLLNWRACCFPVRYSMKPLPPVIYWNNNNNIYLLQLGCYPVAVVILHVNKTWNWLLLNLSREGYMRSIYWQLGIIIIIFINCNWVVTRWQWLFYI